MHREVPLLSNSSRKVASRRGENGRWRVQAKGHTSQGCFAGRSVTQVRTDCYHISLRGEPTIRHKALSVIIKNGSACFYFSNAESQVFLPYE